MKNNPLIQLLFTALCWLGCYLPLQAQFSAGAEALTESKLAWRTWHITNKRGADFLLRVSGNTVYATNNTINDGSTFVVDSGPDDSNWTTPDSRWFYIRQASTGKYVTVASSGDLPRSVSMDDYDELNYGQQFRLIATVSTFQYKLRSRLSNDGPDIVLEINANGVLQGDAPKVDPSSEQKFAFNLAMPNGNDRTYALVGTYKGRYMSDNGIKVDGTQAIQKKDSDESGIWKLTPQGNNYYRIQNNLTKLYLTAPAGSVNGSIPIMTASHYGDRSLWLLDPGDVNFRISNKEFPQLFVSATSMPSGEALRLRTSADPYRAWVISLMPGEIEIAPGEYDPIAQGSLSNQCFMSYGTLFKKALCERIGLNPAQSELYFEFIRAAIAAKMGSNRVDEMLQKMALDNPGHRVDLALMVRYYLTEVLPAIPYNQWPPAAQAAVTEWQNKVQAIRSSYGSRLLSTWNAYVAEQGNNISFADLYFFWLDGDGYEWPSYYQASAEQEPLMRDYVRGAAAFGERNNVIVGSTAVGATVAFSIVYASSAGIKFVISQLAAYFSASVKLLGITASFPMASLLAAAGPPISVAVFAAASLSMQVMEVIELQDFQADFDADYLWSQQPVNIPGTLSGNDLLARIKLLSDLDFILGAPVTDGFQFNTNDNAYQPTFSISCNPSVTLSLDATGAATLSPQMCANIFQVCGTEMQYFLSKSQFDCGDLGMHQVIFAAWNKVDENASNTYVQRCTVAVNVVDEIAPTITCPGDQTLVLGANCSASLPDYIAWATQVSDNCGQVSVTQSPEPGTLVTGGGNMTVTLRVFAANGVTTTCTFTVTKVDQTPPLVVCPPDQTLVLSADCTAAIPDYRHLATTFDACGISSVIQLAAPGFVVSGAGSISATLIVTDVNNNVSQCGFTITKVDHTPPSLQCFPKTLTFNGETQWILDADDLVDASDDCGVASIDLSTAAITCAQVGQVVPVTVSVADVNGNESTCISQITVNGLPCGWGQNPNGVNCTNGSSTAYNAANDLFTLTSTNCYSANFSSDATAFTQRSLCGDGSLTAQVTGISGAMAWAGIVMRESEAAGAKKAQLTTNLSGMTRREFRTTTGGLAMPQQLATPNSSWLRIVRTGSQFSLYTSTNGQAWAFAGAQNIPMDACIQIGLVLANTTANSTATATFANMSFGGGGSNLVSAPADLIQPASAPADFNVYPNPTTGDLTLDLAQYAHKPLRIALYSLEGKLLQTTDIEEVSTTLERLNLAQYPDGMYWVTLRSAGLPPASRRVALIRQ